MLACHVRDAWADVAAVPLLLSARTAEPSKKWGSMDDHALLSHKCE